MPEIIAYEDWSSVAPNRTPGPILMPTPRVWLHHGGKGTPTVRTAEGHARYHIRTLGWSHVGYNYLIAEGKILEGRGPGRVGAHTKGDNTESHGICFAGNHSSTPPSPRDIDALVWLLRHGAERGWWRAPRLTGGHRDSPGGKRSGTTCPGHALQSRIPAVNRAASAGTDRDWIEQGDTGPRVRAWQTSLYALGGEYAVQPDGDFGPRTQKATVAFMADFMDIPDAQGRVGDRTLQTMEDALGKLDDLEEKLDNLPGRTAAEVVTFETEHERPDGRPFGPVMYQLRTTQRLLYQVLERQYGHAEALRLLAECDADE